MARDRIQIKKHVAFKALGGKAKAVYWHLGVRKALEERGFRFVCGPKDQWRGPVQGGNLINPIVGSSAGSFFAVLTAAGWSMEEIYESYMIGSGDSPLRPITARDIFSKNPADVIGYIKRIRNSMKRRRSKWPGIEDFLALRSMYTTDGVAAYLKDVLRGCVRFEDLACELYILTTQLDLPRTVIFGIKDSGQHDDYLYCAGVPIPTAAAASMAIPPIFVPVPIRVRGAIDYYIDGEIRDPYRSNVAEDGGADVIFVSSVYQAYRYTERYGSLYEGGMNRVYTQIIEQSLDAKRVVAELGRRKMKQAIRDLRRYLSRLLPKAQVEDAIKTFAHGMQFRPENRVIYIYPHNDMELYHMHPFDLTPRGMNRIFLKGYHRAKIVLKDVCFDFEEL